MGPLTKALKDIRLGLGFDSAKKFFVYLKQRGLACNYAYYMKIEKGDAFPSSQLLNQIAKSLPQEESHFLIKVYCAEQFQDFDFLFNVQDSINNRASNLKLNADIPKVSELSQGRPELSPRQVNLLARGPQFYYIFVLCTLARNALSPEDLNPYFSKKVIQETVDVLLSENILVRTEKGLTSFAPDVRFPPDSESLAGCYQKFDQWDVLFAEQFEMSEVISKMLIRRISFRYLGLIQKNLEVLFDLIRASDEMDSRHNSHVIQLQVQLKKGVLPG